MQNDNIYIQQLKEKLIEIKPYLVLLFGSYAYGTPNEYSDIDLLVVTNDDFLPQNFDEKNKIYLNVSRQIREIAQQVAVDLLVYTKPMYKKFVEQESSFSHEITTKGIKIYESNNTTVA